MVTHKHHLIPRHEGGTDHPSNLIDVSIEVHAQIHKVRWEAFGHWQDKVAWLTLSKQITCAEATKLTQKLANLGSNNPMYRKTGELNPMWGRKGELSPHWGKKHSTENNNKKRKSLQNRTYVDLHGPEKAEEIKNKLRKPKTEEHKKKLSKPKPKVVSRLCDRKLMSLGNFMNWNKRQ